jgi:hypothetical protein
VCRCCDPAGIGVRGEEGDRKKVPNRLLFGLVSGFRLTGSVWHVTPLLHSGRHAQLRQDPDLQDQPDHDDKDDEKEITKLHWNQFLL